GAAKSSEFQAVHGIDVMASRFEPCPNGLHVNLWTFCRDRRGFVAQFLECRRQVLTRVARIEGGQRTALPDDLGFSREFLQSCSRGVHLILVCTTSASTALTRIFKMTLRLSSGVASGSCSPRPLAESFSRKHDLSG